MLSMLDSEFGLSILVKKYGFLENCILLVLDGPKERIGYTNEIYFLVIH